MPHQWNSDGFSGISHEAESMMRYETHLQPIKSMKTPLVIATVLLAFAGSVLSQILPDTLARNRQGYSVGVLPSKATAWHFQISGKQYTTTMTRDRLLAGPDWTSSMPLPLSFGKAEEIARTELKKLGPDAVSWEVTDIWLKRYEDQQKWYYVIGLKPGASSAEPNRDSFFAVMNLSGEVGTIESNPIHR